MFNGYRQFIVYRVVPSASRPGKTDKFPIDYRDGKRVDASDPAIWLDQEVAQSIADAWGDEYGVGFVFTENDPFWFLDIDECLVNGQWSNLAQQACKLFAGCYVEVSQSGRGLHIFGVGAVPAHGCKNDDLGIEFYHTKRFAALTGTNATGSEFTEATIVLPPFLQAYFPPIESNVDDDFWSEGPCEEWNGPTDDANLIRRAMNSRSVASVFGNKATFSDLWLANEPVLALNYPDPVRPYNESAADRALAQHLAFWTGRDCARIERIMWESRLVREKWNRPDYLPRTIRGAVGTQHDVLVDRQPVPPPPADAPEPLRVTDGRIPIGTNNGFMNPVEQLQHFKGCVYVKSLHRVFVPDGSLLKPDQFKVHFAGFNFSMDNANERSSRDAWECFTQSQVNRCPSVEGVCFKPNKPSGAVLDNLVNIYVPVVIPRKQGDPTPFLVHLAKVLPDERDRSILLSYMAACVQHQGVKFQWAPLLQGVEGNGKTFFARCVAAAIGRRYVHFPPAHEISEKFNSWLFDTIFIGVEDIYVPNQKQEIFEILKPMITSDYLAKRAMQQDQVMRDVVANFIFNSNHKDGIRKTRNDRRIATFFCAQQYVEDLSRDGMHGDYFPILYNWLKADGYAIVSEFLFTYPIAAEFNPAGDCQRAPNTSTTEEAIQASVGNIEQEILEAVSQGHAGFCGGWISSIFLDRLLQQLNVAGRISRHKRKELLEHMGYRYHPCFKDGQVNNAVTPDGGKPRLFIHSSSLAMQITNAAEATKHYENANMNKALPFSARA